MRTSLIRATFLVATIATALAANACSLLVSTTALSGGDPDGGPGAKPASAGDTGAPDAGLWLGEAGPVSTVTPIADSGAPVAVDAGDGVAAPEPGPVDACIPSAPACDGRDHACDGVVDEGCPAAVTIGAPGASQLLGGTTTGGNPFSDTCPSGQVLIGMGGVTGPWIDAVYGLCGAVSIAVTTSSKPYAYSVTIAPGATLPLHGTVGAADVAWVASCPANEAIVAVAGNSGSAMDQVALSCAPLRVTGVPGGFALHQGGETALAPQGDDGGGSPFAPVVCPDPQVIAAMSGSAGDWVDSLAVACAVPGIVVVN
jgi:hypothetical protein